MTRSRNVRRDTFNTPPPFVSDEFEEETLYQVAFAPLLRPTEREKPVVVAPRGPEPEEPEDPEPLPEPKPVTTVTSFGSELEPPEPEPEPKPQAPSQPIPEAIPDA